MTGPDRVVGLDVNEAMLAVARRQRADVTWREAAAEALPFVDWHRGERSWCDVVAAGDIQVHGAGPLVRALPTWNLHHPVIAAP